MKWLSLACVIVVATATEARSQSNFTYVETRDVLVDNATGREWQCGFGLDWSYRTYFPVSYDNAKDVCPGVYSAGPYGDGGGWRMPTTAELSDALRKGLYDELRLVAYYRQGQQLAAGIPPGDDRLCRIPDDSVTTPFWSSWVVDPKTTKRDAFYIV